MVILRECQGEGFAFAYLHAAHGIFKLLEHLAFAYQELKVFGFTASEQLAVDLAFKVHGHAIAVLCGSVLSAQGEGAALFAQNFHRFVDGGIVDFSRQALHFGISQIGNLHFWEDF